MRAPLKPPSALRQQPHSQPNSKTLEREELAKYQTPTMVTPYMVMTLQANEAPRRDNFLAALFSWLILAGFVVFPGTFTSVENSGSLENSKGGKVVKHTIQYVPLLPFASLCYLIGIGGTVRLWKGWGNNYVWLLAHLFMPGLLNAVAGWMNTLINIYTSHGGHWSTTAIFTFVLISLYMLSMLALNLAYNRFLKKIKTDHDREVARQRIERKYSEAPKPMS